MRHLRHLLHLRRLRRLCRAGQVRFPLLVLLTTLLLIPGCFAGSAGLPLVKAGQLLPLVKAGEKQAPAAIFPMVSSYALDKQRVVLPQGLDGEMNLLLLSFAPDQQREVESWTSTAQSLQHTDDRFRAYRLPLAERENAEFRWWANASLRSAETDPEAWHYVVPLYVNKHSFLEQLGIAGEKNVVALLVDKGGHVLWRTEGAATAETRSALKEITKRTR